MFSYGLAQNKQQYDLILLDPPTFSNSKRMDKILDIQKDHIELIHMAMRALSTEGILIFSNNFVNLNWMKVYINIIKLKDYTEQSFDPDFMREKNFTIAG